MLFTDNMMMPKTSTHPYAAETMMNYVYEPGGRGEDRGLRELHLAGEGRQGDPRKDRSRSSPTTR